MFHGKLPRIDRAGLSARFHNIVLVDDIEEGQPSYDSAVLQASSSVWVCPMCGDTWGKLFSYYISRRDKEPRRSNFSAVSAVCESCGDGSVLQAGIWPVVSSRLGPEITRRELELCLQQEIQRQQQKAL